jgi:hypothetical protein
MTTPTLRRLFAGAFAASCLAGLPVSAVHAVGVIPVTDTVTDLYLDWSFAIGDSGVLAPYVGSYWLAEILPSWTGAGWSVDAWYQHLGGPHLEPPESVMHYMGNVTFVSGFGVGMAMPVQDHELPGALPPHVGAHTGSLAANGPAIDPSLPLPPGFAQQIVTHVPEPAQWWLMLAGLGGLAAMVRRRV